MGNINNNLKDRLQIMSLFVGNISKNVSISQLEEEFFKFGRCEIKQHGSYAFIVFDDDKSAEDAMEQLNGLNMGGLHLGVEWSKRSGKFDPRQSRRPPSFGHFARDCRSRRRSRSRSHDRDRRRGSRSRSPRDRRDHRDYRRRSPDRRREGFDRRDHDRDHRNPRRDDRRRDSQDRKDGRDDWGSRNERRDRSRSQEREKRDDRDRRRRDSPKRRSPE